MAINLNKYRENLQNAWKDVLDDKTDTNWALFGYEGQTNDLKVVGTGSDGLQELTEEFNSGKIMYAFVKIDDPKTSLPKCVLINWQGEGANTVRKGICANHLRDIEKFFTGAHLTINARNEDEVDADLIIQKVSKVGSAYSFKNRVEPVEQTKPVGTNYKRVNPIKEINAQERDQFWMREEQEEKIRLEEEYKKRELERRKLEEDIKQREIEESLIRDARTKERNNSIDQVKQAEKIAYEKQKSHEQSRYVEDVECKVNRSDLLRQERKKEAQELIGKRTIDARSIFEQNTSAGQIKKTPEKPVRASILKAQSQIVQNQVQNEELEVNKVKNLEMGDFQERFSQEKNFQERISQENISQEKNFQEKYQEKNFQEKNFQEKNPQGKIPQEKISEEQISQLQTSQSQISSSQMTEEPGSDDDSDQFATIKRSPKDIEKKNPTSPIVEEKNGINVNKPVEVAKEEVKEQPRVLTEQQFVDEVIYGDLSDPGYQARALYDYQAADDTEITFDPGDVITHIEFVDEGWWQGLGPDGTYGLFPANYVELIQE